MVDDTPNPALAPAASTAPDPRPAVSPSAAEVGPAVSPSAADGAPTVSPSAAEGRPARSVKALFAAFASAVVPGVGQLIRGRVGDGVFFFAMSAWLHLFLAGQAGPGARTLGLFFGAPATAHGLRTPIFVVFTVLALVLHVGAALDAARLEKGSGEVR